MENNINLFALKSFKGLETAIKNKKNLSVFGMGFSEKILSAVNLSDKIFYVAKDLASAKAVYDEFKAILKTGVYYFPTGSDCLLYRHAQSNENNKDRIKTAFALELNKVKVVVSTAEALFSYLPKREVFKDNIIKLKINQTIEIVDLKNQFIKMGYVSKPLVTEAGQFSVRGEIVDVFPINSDFPFRIEMFDNLIESIKIFDTKTQRSSENRAEISMCPYTNLILNKSDIDKIRKKIEELRTTAQLTREAQVRLETILNEVVNRLENHDLSFSMDFLFPLISENLGTIFDYLSTDFKIIFDETKMVYDALILANNEIKDRKKDLTIMGETLPTKEVGYLSVDQILSGFKKYVKIAHQKITSANRLFEPDEVFSFRFAPLIKYSNNLNEFVNDLTFWITDGYKVFICAGGEDLAKSLSKKLEKNDIFLEFNPKTKITDCCSAITPYFLTKGFVLPEEKIVVVGTHDLFPKKSNQSSIVKRNSVFSVPEVGSFVVHRFHGIGKCEGITKLTGSFGTKDFIVVGYYGGDKLYVPIDQMDQLDKYSAGGDPKKLSKIGGSDFGAVKERVKKQIKEMAFSLLKLYAEREQKSGYLYRKDEELQLEFENKFPFTETEDQLNAINEVKADMENGKVMDRLICGDVGFGKTEVALRTAFKTIVNGKQVAFIAPTTILARQHYNTCLSRMAEFGIRVEVLDRFVPAKKAKELLLALKEHKIDILCGTHKILGKDVVFEDLGLVILDEEQKFGVEHKEKIKLEQKNINVLTLSATPIPRTLHMSLSGIRDISIISTPPTNRTPTQTYVTEYTDTLLKSVIERELKRDGQTFVVYNRVESIYAFVEHVRTLVPNARIVVGHGQLSGAELEDVIYKFYNHQADVLVCTTIIENGIDLPNANSLLVVDSDRLGLSQLYQIRGRVGRGNRAGFAYFTYKRDKSLSEESYKRLEAIAEFTEFGSGFKVAMRDLEIRGSGNVFGAQQHGHIEKVGYELYSKMLQNAILELKGGLVKEYCECLVKVNLDAFIPEHYIENSEERMSIYKNISLIASSNERSLIITELTDRYGNIPMPLINLINIGYVKSLAKQFNVTEIFMNENVVRLTFKSVDDVMACESLNYAIAQFKSKVVLNLNSVATITFRNLKSNPEDNFKMLEDFLLLATPKN